MKRIILTALDNNDKIYYDNLVPFILSLKETDYQGDIGIIDYGLSEEKKVRLTENNIHIFPASRTCKELLLDRHISAADIAETYQYDQVAVYDCDIWFPTKHLTVFDQIQDNEGLYCTYDAWSCSFLFTCVKPDFLPLIRPKVEMLIDKQGNAWQAAVLLGSQKAWLDYKLYIVTQLNAGYFFEEYGIDATMLNLYQADCEKLHFIHQKYNCIPVSGIENRRGYRGDWGYYYQDQLVEGLHITRNHREDPFLSYKQVNANKYYHDGKMLATHGQHQYNVIRESMVVFEPEEHNTTLELVSVSTNGGHLSTKIEESGDVFKKGALWIDVAGESRIVLRNPHSVPVKLFYLWNTVTQHTPCSRMYIRYESGSEFSGNLNHLYFIELAPNEKIEFCSQDLDLNRSRARWVFDNVRLV